MAFSLEERLQVGIHGLLPPCFIGQDVQLLRVLKNYDMKRDDLDRWDWHTNTDGNLFTVSQEWLTHLIIFKSASNQQPLKSWVSANPPCTQSSTSESLQDPKGITDRPLWSLHPSPKAIDFTLQTCRLFCPSLLPPLVFISSVESKWKPQSVLHASLDSKLLALGNESTTC